MDELPEEVIGRELGASERLLWCGRPSQGLILRAADAFLIPLSLLWGGFAIFWEASVITKGAPLDFGIFRILFVLIGLYIMVGRFWVDARQRASTVYAITSERVVIVSGILSRRVKSLSIDTLSDVSLTERSGGGGLITFGSTPFPYGWLVGTSWPSFGQSSVPNFELPDRAREIYELIREARRTATRRA